MKALLVTLSLFVFINMSLSTKSKTISMFTLIRHGARSTDKYSKVASKLTYETETYHLTHLDLVSYMIVAHLS